MMEVPAVFKTHKEDDAMFFFWKKSREPAGKRIALENQESEIVESLNVVAGKGRSELERTEAEAREKLREAARIELQDLRMIEDGRCPRCGRKLDIYLYTTICRNCGWNNFITPRRDGTVVRLKTGSALTCDRTYNADAEVLCVRSNVVISRVPRENIDYIEFAWSESEIEDRQARLEVERGGTCSWCQKRLGAAANGNGNGLKPDTAAGEPSFPTGHGEHADAAERHVIYVSFGALQERHVFCSEQCLTSFKRQYPPRVHRNCYETECADCDACIKRYDVPRGKGNLSELEKTLGAPKR